MPIPDHYKIYCDNPELKVYSCDFMIHEDCPATCSLSIKLSKGITHMSKTGLERFMDRYGDDWRLIAFGEQCPIIPNVPDEVKGEYKE